MIYVFTGSDRAKIQKEAEKILGEGYEVFSGENLEKTELANVFQGNSLFSTERRILLKDIAELDAYEEISEYVNTPHTVVIWETKPSQKKAYKDFLKSPQVKAQKFDLPEGIDMRTVFNIYDVALTDGPRAVKMLAAVKEKEEPYRFFGLLASQAIKKYEWNQNAQTRKALKELSKLDGQLKSTTIEPWTLIESFLARLSSF